MPGPNHGSIEEATLNNNLARGLYFGLQRLRGEPVAEVLRELAGSQHWPYEQLADLQ